MTQWIVNYGESIENVTVNEGDTLAVSGGDARGVLVSGGVLYAGGFVSDCTINGGTIWMGNNYPILQGTVQGGCIKLYGTLNGENVQFLSGTITGMQEGALLKNCIIGGTNMIDVRDCGLESIQIIDHGILKAYGTIAVSTQGYASNPHVSVSASGSFNIYGISASDSQSPSRLWCNLSDSGSVNLNVARPESGGYIRPWSLGLTGEGNFNVSGNDTQAAVVMTSPNIKTTISGGTVTLSGSLANDVTMTGGTLELSSSTVSNATLTGGTVTTSHSAGTIQNATITSGDAVLFSSIAVGNLLVDSGNLTMTQCTLQGATVSSSGILNMALTPNVSNNNSIPVVLDYGTLNISGAPNANRSLFHGNVTGNGTVNVSRNSLFWGDVNNGITVNVDNQEPGTSSAPYGSYIHDPQMGSIPCMGYHGTVKNGGVVNVRSGGFASGMVNAGGTVTCQAGGLLLNSLEAVSPSFVFKQGSTLEIQDGDCGLENCAFEAGATVNGFSIGAVSQNKNPLDGVYGAANTGFRILSPGAFTTSEVTGTASLFSGMRANNVTLHSNAKVNVDGGRLGYFTVDGDNAEIEFTNGGSLVWDLAMGDQLSGDISVDMSVVTGAPQYVVWDNSQYQNAFVAIGRSYVLASNAGDFDATITVKNSQFSSTSLEYCETYYQPSAISSFTISLDHGYVLGNYSSGGGICYALRLDEDDNLILDKTNPMTVTADADVIASSRIITVTTPSDNTIQYCSTSDTTWKTYTQPIVATSNGIWYFRLVDDNGVSLTFTQSVKYTNISTMVGGDDDPCQTLTEAMENTAEAGQIQFRSGTFAVSSEDMTKGVVLNGAANMGDGAGETVFACMEKWFMNGNDVEINDATVEFGLPSSASVYGGVNHSGSGEPRTYYMGSLKIKNTVLSGAQVYGGGKIVAALPQVLEGDSSLSVSGNSQADRLYAGYDVLETGNNTSTLTGNSILEIGGGTYGIVRGGMLKSDNSTGGGLTVVGNAETTLSNSTVTNGVAGDYQVGANAQYTRIGDVSVSISNGTQVKGSVTGAGLSFGGEYLIKGGEDSTGSVELNVNGGVIGGNLFGGTSVGNTGNAVADSRFCNIRGNVTVAIDCSENDVTIGSAENLVTSIYAGSFAKGVVGGEATLRITGDSAKLHLLGRAVEFIGDSSAATTDLTFVEGGSRLVFDAFGGEDALNVQNIGAFTSIEFLNGSQVHVTNLRANKLDKVSTWKFDAAEGLTLFTVDTFVKNDFAGDLIDISFDQETLTSCTLMNTNNDGWFTGLESADIRLNGDQAQWDDTYGAYCSEGFGLSIDTEKHDLILSKLA